MSASSPLTPPTQNEILEKEQLARFLWTGFIIMFFGIQAIIWTIAISLTSNDVSHAVVHDFGKRSTDLPTQVSRNETNRRLGWTSLLDFKPPASRNPVAGQITVNLSIRDRAGQPVSVPLIELTAFHCGQAAKVQKIELTPTEPGNYQGILRLQKNGQWQFDSTIRHDDETYYFSERQSL